MLSIGQWRLLRHVKAATRDRLKTDGFALVAGTGVAGVALPTGPLHDSDIDKMWAKAEAKGELSDAIILDYAASGAGAPVGAIGDGILAFFKRVIDWISDPANQQKIQAIIAFIMGILAIFGL